MSTAQFSLPPISFRPWREIALACLAVMEVSWAAMFYRSIPLPGLQVTFERAFAVIGGLLLLGCCGARLLNYLNLKMKLRRLALFLATLISLYVGMKLLVVGNEGQSLVGIVWQMVGGFNDMGYLVPGEYLVILTVTFIWWRGVDLAAMHVEPNNVLLSFRFGVVMLLVAGAMSPRLEPSSGRATFLFLCFGLLSLSTCRIHVLGYLRGGRTAPFDRRWMLGILFSVAGMLGLIAGLVTLVGDTAFEQLALVVSIAGKVLMLGMLVILAPFIYVLSYLFVTVGTWAGYGRVWIVMSELARQLLDIFGDVFQNSAESMQKQVAAMKVFSYGVIFLAVLLLTLVAIRARAWRNQADRERIELAGGSWSEDLRNLFGGKLRKFGERLGNLLVLRRSERLLAAAHVRRIYAQLLELSEKLGQPRPTSTTPREFLAKLNATLPDLAAELEVITDAYQRVRYGELPETMQEVRSVDDAWQHVLSVGEGKIKARKPSPLSPLPVGEGDRRIKGKGI